MACVAGLALVVRLVIAVLTYPISKESVNIRATFLYNLADAQGSVAVLAFGWVSVSPVVTLAIAGYILWMSLAQIGSVISILMHGAPLGHDTRAVLDHLRGINGVVLVHHVHLWQMQK